MSNINYNTCGMPVQNCGPWDDFMYKCRPCPFCCCPCPVCPPCPAPESRTFTVVYNPNGGFGGTADFDLIEDTVYIIKTPEEAGVSRPNYRFLSWNTQPDGSGIAYRPGDGITITENLILYAQWETEPPETADIIYDPNGGTGGLVDTVIRGSHYIIKTPSETDVTHSGYEFTGWNTAQDGSGTAYVPGEAVTVTSTLLLYAQWCQITYTITYHKNDPVVPDGQKVTYGPYGEGTTVTVISASQTGFYVPGYVFIGWNTQWDGSGISYPQNAQITINSNMNLYAMWMRRD